MATATATITPHSSYLQSPSILEEVEAIQEHLRTRLAGALDAPPPNIPEKALPTVPLIDIGASFSTDGSASAAKKAIAAQIREACLVTGFFQISNHGVSDEAISGVFKQAQRFFHDLSAQQKEKVHAKHSPLFRGYEPHDYSQVNPDDAGKEGTGHEQRVETKEGFNWGYEEGFDPDGSDGKYVELDGQAPRDTGLGNLWPSEEDLPGFYDAVRLYHGQTMRLAKHLFRLFALSLGLEEDYFDEVVTHSGGIARLIYYKAIPGITGHDTSLANEGSQLGLGAHTDYECFTLLLSSSNPGLEILFPPSPLTDDKPVWLPCPVRPGTFTINVADFLMRWTNGLYKSTIHRVVSRPGSGERYSVPFFFSINYDAEVKALPESVVGKSLFKPMKAGEYVLERLRATRLEEEK